MTVLARRELLGVGFGAAVSGFAPAALAQAPRSSRFDWKLRRPEEAGMSRAGIEGIRSAIQKHIDAGNLTGAVSAVVRRNKLVWYEAQGIRDIETRSPMRKDDIFRMMSSSKHVAAVAALIMMDEGKLSIDDPVSKFIPSFKGQKVALAPDGWQAALSNPAKLAEVAKQVKLVPAERDITIKDLLTHTSGLASTYGAGPGPSTLVHKTGLDLNKTLAEVIPTLGEGALDFQPGSRWGYSGLFGLDTVLRIVEIVSGQPADIFMRERLFQPLDMRDTFFSVPSDKYGRVLTLYAKVDGQWRPQRAATGYGQVKYFSGGGGLVGTVHDFIQLEQMLYNKGELNGRRILKPGTVELMSTNHVGNLFAEWIPSRTKGMGYGLGVGVVVDPVVADTGRGKGAFGWGGAYGTESWVDPDLDLTAAIFVQQPNTSVSTDFQKAIKAAIVA